MLSLDKDRQHMIERQLQRRGLKNADVLRAMKEVPREAFVPEALREHAYEDTPLPIDVGQTISQPYIVALMIDAAEVTPGDRVLEVGAGSGYAAAVLSRIAGRVYAIERHRNLAMSAAERLRRLGYHNIEVRAGDGARGWIEAAPFDAILVSASGEVIRQALKEQLDIGGVLVMPVGAMHGQRLIKVHKSSANSYEQQDLGAVSFVPLIAGES
jgi:protein-L-isoaspartate(D-aspartate) O-methyltransferase